METSPVAEHLSRLSVVEQEELEAAAISQSHGLAVEGYRPGNGSRQA